MVETAAAMGGRITKVNICRGGYELRVTSEGREEGFRGGTSCDIQHIYLRHSQCFCMDGYHHALTIGTLISAGEILPPPRTGANTSPVKTFFFHLRDLLSSEGLPAPSI